MTETVDDIFRGYGVKIKLNDQSNFLKIKETLQRIGIPSKNILYQSVHVLHKQGQYVIIHFKELFAFDGKTADITDQDLGRRNTIAALLSEWGLCEVLEPAKIESPKVPVSELKIIPYKDRSNWQLEAKYDIGKKRYTQK